jgi:hypothetical protein
LYLRTNGLALRALHTSNTTPLKQNNPSRIRRDTTKPKHSLITRLANVPRHVAVEALLALAETAKAMTITHAAKFVQRKNCKHATTACHKTKHHQQRLCALLSHEHVMMFALPLQRS